MNIIDHRHFDAILLGAGGAGMLLLHSLHKSGWLATHKVAVIDPNSKDSNDRTWCFWAKETDQIVVDFNSIISKQWTKVNNGMGTIESLDQYNYYHLRSSDLYQIVKQQCSANITWMKESAINVDKYNEVNVVETENQEFTAPIIFDSRPFSTLEFNKITTNHDLIWQSFYGMRIKTEASFNQEICTLMDFNVPQKNAAQFVYTLPTSENEALVELTRFGNQCINEIDGREILGEYIKENYGSYIVCELEQGKIPMTLAFNTSSKKKNNLTSIIPIGTRAGAIKSTTGYAFKNMAAHADAIANSLISSNDIPSIQRHRRLSFYDRILLRVLKTNPSKGKQIFQSLFANCKTSVVLSFLDEDVSLRNEIKILSSLPILVFLKGMFSILFNPSISTKDENQKELKPYLGLGIVGFSIALCILNWVSSSSISIISPWVLVAGLIWPGIPHGALDHWIELREQYSHFKIITFISKYVIGMCLIGLLWYVSPIVGFLFFLAYSAWHFGETDLIDWGNFSVFRSIVWGASLLGTMLFGHLDELAPYLAAYQLDNLYGYMNTYQPYLLAVSIVGLTAPISNFNSKVVKLWLPTAAVIIIGLYLPLLLAFALYFIGCHSFRGWYHLQHSLRQNNVSMVLKSLPFSIGAWVISIGVFYYFFQSNQISLSETWSYMFFFIAAISAPHVWMMSSFYRKS